MNTNLSYLPYEDAVQAARGLIDNHKEAVLTDNGRPVILMLDISCNEPEDIVDAVIRSRAIKAFENMRAMAEKRGWMTEEEIEAEIEAFRREKREREQGVRSH